MEVGGLAWQDDNLNESRWSVGDDLSQFLLTRRRHVHTVDCLQNITHPGHGNRTHHTPPPPLSGAVLPLGESI